MEAAFSALPADPSQTLLPSHDQAYRSVLSKADPAGVQAALSRRTICRLEQLAKGLLLWIECSDATAVVHAIVIGVCYAGDVKGLLAARHEIK